MLAHVFTHNAPLGEKRSIKIKIKIKNLIFYHQPQKSSSEMPEWDVLSIRVSWHWSAKLDAS